MSLSSYLFPRVALHTGPSNLVSAAPVPRPVLGIPLAYFFPLLAALDMASIFSDCAAITWRLSFIAAAADAQSSCLAHVAAAMSMSCTHVLAAAALHVVLDGPLHPLLGVNRNHRCYLGGHIHTLVGVNGNPRRHLQTSVIVDGTHQCYLGGHVHTLMGVNRNHCRHVHTSVCVNSIH